MHLLLEKERARESCSSWRDKKMNGKQERSSDLRMLRFG